MTPKVKPLVWVAVELDRGDGSSDLTGGWTADTEIGEYVIDIGFGSDCYYWSVQAPDGFDVGSDFDDLLYAKAAAQADYDARIIAALDPAWLAALEAQVKAVAEWHDARTAILAADQSDTATLPAMVTRLANAEWALVTAYRTAKEASHG